MSLPFFIAFATTILFGLLAIYFSFREQYLKKQLQEREAIQKRRLYEISTLRAIQDRIGYSLDIERVIDTLTGSLKNLFPYSTASSLILEPTKLVFKTAIEEQVSRNFVDEVKKSMIASLSTLIDHPLPSYIDEVRTGMLPDENNKKILASFFHIPLVVNGQIVGLINVSSTKPGLYKDEDMTILYQMTSIASNALSRLHDVIQTEEEKLLALIGSLSDGILSIDANMQLTLINQAGKRLIGLQDKASITIADVVPIVSGAFDLLATVKQAMQTKKTLQQDKVAIGNKVMRIIVTPVMQIEPDVQSVIGATVTLHDITLETSLASLKEDFTNGIVHELRAPLSAIKSGTELLISDPTLAASQEKLLKIIEEQTKRMIGDIDSLLDAAKIEAGKLMISKNPEDLKTIVRDVISLFEPEADIKHVILTTNIDPNLPNALADKGRIEQVLENLLSNSLKYTPSGGTIQISAALTHQEHLPQSPTNPGILITVSDTGNGIPKDKQAYLFSKFAQIGSTPVPHGQQGTGLGLYISKGIVTAHGGQIFLSSQEGKGTTVSFTLPLAPAQSPTLMHQI